MLAFWNVTWSDMLSKINCVYIFTPIKCIPNQMNDSFVINVDQFRIASHQLKNCCGMAWQQLPWCMIGEPSVQNNKRKEWCIPTLIVSITKCLKMIGCLWLIGFFRSKLSNLTCPNRNINNFFVIRQAKSDS